MPNDNNIIDQNAVPPTSTQPSADIIANVVNKITEAHNILVALSSDPSVDEMAAAIGLSLFLDKMGKRATAIYSSNTPNALEFLKPEETFEPSVDTLQDFVIALSKEKADHLRYKLDGDFVKIYITPYRTRIGEEDLDFSYGDFNVDLVLALDVANGVDLDSALREHGRIMHDASIVNITTGNPGKLGEIEWSDKSASSVSEMIARLLYSQTGKFKIEKEEATAFLTGIVAATNRFSNAKTTPESMKLASRLMESGANQQLISKNITPDIDNELYSLATPDEAKTQSSDPTKLSIEHKGEEVIDGPKEVDTVVTEKESTLLDDLKAAEASLAQAGAETTPEPVNEPVNLDQPGSIDSASGQASDPAPTITDTSVSPELSPVPEIPPESTSSPVSGESSELPPVLEPTPVSTLEVSPISTQESPADTAVEPGLTSDMPAADFTSDKSEKVLQPSDDLASGFLGDENSSKYGQMLEDALSGIDTPSSSEPTASSAAENPAAMSAPAVSPAPEINGVPEINYMPMPGEEVLPPPPTPPIDMNINTPEVPTPAPAPTTQAPAVTPITPAIPVVEPTPTPLGTQPAMQDQVYTPQASDPSAFKIPGM